MTTRSRIVKLTELYRKEAAEVFARPEVSVHVADFVEEILSAYERGATVFVAGNGGNAAFVGNLVTDLNLHPFVSDDKGEPGAKRKTKFKCVDLCCHPSTITGIMNDFGPDHIFSEQLKYLASDDDVFIGFTGSGNSKNIVVACMEAKCLGMRVIGVTKSKDSYMAKYSHTPVVIPGDSEFPGQTSGNNNNFHFEDFLSKLSHIACGILKEHVQKAAP